MIRLALRGMGYSDRGKLYKILFEYIYIRSKTLLGYEFGHSEGRRISRNVNSGP